jgi:hypothetical protein
MVATCDILFRTARDSILLGLIDPKTQIILVTISSLFAILLTMKKLGGLMRIVGGIITYGVVCFSLVFATWLVSIYWSTLVSFGEQSYRCTRAYSLPSTAPPLIARKNGADH